MQLVLAEYEPSGDIELTTEQRDALRLVAPSISVTPAMGKEGVYELTPGSEIGVVSLPDGLELVIRPKVRIENVLFLISYGLGLGRWMSAPAGLVEASALTEAVVKAFTYQVQRALVRGVLQGYREREEALQTVRGRWRIGDQLRNHYGLAPPVEIAYDDFTEDIEVNRLLLAAAGRLLRLPMRNESSRWPLRAIENRLSGVEPVVYDRRRIPDPALDRRGLHYRAAVALARFILANSSFDLRPGTRTASAFLIDMNRVFEDFVVIALREALRVSDRVLVQGARGHALHFDVAGQLVLRPDISYWSAGKCRFVGDVKYKRLRADGYPNADIYQLTAYAIATELPGGLLIYAAGSDDRRVHQIVHIRKLIELVPVDLDAGPTAVLSRVQELADRIADDVAGRVGSSREAAQQGVGPIYELAG